MTYEVRPAQDGLWTVVNDRDQIVFTGNWQQCEDWLDLQQNIGTQPRTNRGRTTLARVFRRLLGWGADCVSWLGRQRTIAIGL